MIASPNQFDFELPEEPFHVQEERRKGISDTAWNRVTLIFFIATVMMAILMASVFLQPNSGLNPFPPVVIPPTVVIPTETPTIQPTWTTVPTRTARPTRTFTPTNEITATFTIAPTEGFVLPSVTPTAGTVYPTSKVTDSAYPFVVQPGSPANVSSAIMRPDDGCNWMGIGGQVVDMQGAPIVGLRVQLYGSFHGKIKTVPSLTGTVDRYGPAGYEITIADYPSATTRTLWVQLFNQSGGALSDKVYFNTYDGCEKNLTIIHFKQVK